MRAMQKIILCGLLFAGLSAPGLAEMRVRDDLGRTVQLASPARRIVSLAPHITEMLFTAGAGGQVVGAVQYSNFPAAARKIPRVGNYELLDIERIIALKPDLVVAWQSGNIRGQVRRIEALGIPVYYSEPRRLKDIASTILKLGVLTGHKQSARRRSMDFLHGLQVLRASYGKRRKVSVFYQIWHRPLMTIGGRHFISKVIELCGGRNVFANERALAPRIGIESVIARRPQTIIASGMAEKRPQWLAYWKTWPQIPATKNGHLYFIPPDLMQRPTSRLLTGAAIMCRQIDRVRTSTAP